MEIDLGWEYIGVDRVAIRRKGQPGATSIVEDFESTPNV